MIGELGNIEIMSRDVVVARWIDKHLEVERQDLLPLFLRRVASADEWLKTRAIDGHRTNSRLLKRALRLAEGNDMAAVLHAHGATITDTYWVRDIGSNLTYKDIRFTDNPFADLALRGIHFDEAGDSKTKHTPELTNTGSFEKCWRWEQDSWYMIKRANPREAFSELFVSRLCQELNIPAAVYEPDPNGVRTQDFTQGASVNFEPASSFLSEDTCSGDYEEMYEALIDVCPNAGQSFANMIFVDAVCYNVDRHLGNFGVLRDPESGEVLSMAPLFDHNLALIARDYPVVGRSDILLRDFRAFIENHPEFAENIPVIREEMVWRIVDELPYEVDGEYVRDLILSRQELAWGQSRDPAEHDNEER